MRTEVRLVSGGRVVRLWLPEGWDACRFNGSTYRLRRMDGGRVGVRVRR